MFTYNNVKNQPTKTVKIYKYLEIIIKENYSEEIKTNIAQAKAKSMKMKWSFCYFSVLYYEAETWILKK